MCGIGLRGQEYLRSYSWIGAQVGSGLPNWSWSLEQGFSILVHPSHLGQTGLGCGGTCPAHHKISVAFWLPAPPTPVVTVTNVCRHFRVSPLPPKIPLIENPCTRLFCLLWNFPSLLISLFLLSTGLKQIIRVCANSPNGRGHHAQPILGLHTSGRTLCSVLTVWLLSVAKEH